MAGILISWENLVANATVTADSEASLLPASNLKTTIVEEVWRSTSENAVIDVDFGADVDLGVLAFAQPNDATAMLASSDTVRHALDADGGTPGSGVVYDSGIIPNGVIARHGYHLHDLGGAVSARYWRMTVTGTSLASLGYMDMGVLWAGAAWQPTNSISYGWGRQAVAGGGRLVIGARSLVQYPAEGARARVLTLSLDAVKPSEVDGLNDFLFDVADQRQILVCLDPDAFGRKTLLCRLRDAPTVTHRLFSRYALPITLLESR